MGYLFMLPWTIGVCIFMAYPLGWSLYTSFHNVRMTGSGFKYEWVGLANYKFALFSDNEYSIQIFAFFQEMILMIPIIVLFSFFVSIFLNQKFTGRFVFRAFFFLPVIFGTGQVLLELFRQGAGEPPFISQYGIDTMIVQYIPKRLAEPVMQVLGQVIIILWYSGVQILIFISGYQTIPKAIYEAVRIDGASPWESFWKITLPAMVPFLLLNTLYTIVDLFTFPLNPVMEQVKKNMFNPETGYGYASSLAWFYFAIILVVIGVFFWLAQKAFSRKKEA